MNKNLRQILAEQLVELHLAPLGQGNGPVSGRRMLRFCLQIPQLIENSGREQC
eukprot:m.168259 g.168259  ORF g.168259 m.168259 type:complete len:53 (+) comp38951_c0_seq4:111-269(+)